MIETFTVFRGVRNGWPYFEVEINSNGSGKRYSNGLLNRPDLPGDLKCASAILTGTTGSVGDGIFTLNGNSIGPIGRNRSSEVCEVRFWYGPDTNRFEFAPITLRDPPDLIRRRIIERINDVRAWVTEVAIPDEEESIEVDVPVNTSRPSGVAA